MVLVVLIWGLNLTISKWALREFPPLAFTAIRFAVGSLLLLVVLRASEGPIRFPRTAWLPMLVLGLIGNSLYQLLFMLGLERTTPSNSGLVLAALPVAVAALGAASGTERLSGKGMQGIALAFVGVCLVIASHGLDFSNRTVQGDLLTFAGMLAWAVFTLGVRRFKLPLSTLAITTFTTLTGTPVLIAAGIPDLLSMDWGRTTVLGWAALGYACFISLGTAYILWNRSVRVLGPNRTAIYNTMTPLVAMLSSVLLLSERIVPTQVIGGALVIAGVLRAQRPPSPTAVATAKELL